MKIPTEEYRKITKILKNYQYNKRKVQEIESDILGISSKPTDSFKASNGISDPVFNQLMQLEMNEDRKRCIKECKIVEDMLMLINKESHEVFEKEFIDKKKRWQIIKELNISESTYERRTSECKRNCILHC